MGVAVLVLVGAAGGLALAQNGAAGSSGAARGGEDAEIPTDRPLDDLPARHAAAGAPGAHPPACPDAPR